MRGIRGTRGMFTRIPGNLLEDSGECYYLNILGNVEEDSGECWRRFWGMLKKIPGNVWKDFGECSKRFRGIFQKILGNVSKDSGECWQRFSRMLKKIERLIMQLNENRIKGYILKYDKKCKQKYIKTSHVNENV